MGLFPEGTPAGDLAKKAVQPVVKAAVAALSVGLKFLPADVLPTDVIGIARAVKDRDWEFLKGWGLPDEAASTGARAVGTHKFYIRELDGTVTEQSMTLKDAAAEFKKGESTVKKANASGRLEDGRRWARNADDLQEIAAGAKKVKDFIDPSTVERVKGARMGWSGISEATRQSLESDIVKALFKVATDKAENEAMELVNDGILRSGTEFIDYNVTRQFAEELGEEAWGSVSEALMKYQDELGPEKWNKLMGWARNQIFNPFDKDFDGRITQGLLSGFSKSGSRQWKIVADTPGNEWLKGLNFDEKMKSKILDLHIADRVANVRGKALNTDAGRNAAAELFSSVFRLPALDQFNYQKGEGILVDLMDEIVKVLKPLTSATEEQIKGAIMSSKLWGRKGLPAYDPSFFNIPPDKIVNPSRVLVKSSSPGNEIMTGNQMTMAEYIAMGPHVFKDALEVFGSSEMKAAVKSIWDRKTAFKNNGGLVVY